MQSSAFARLASGITPDRRRPSSLPDFARPAPPRLVKAAQEAEWRAPEVAAKDLEKTLIVTRWQSESDRSSACHRLEPDRFLIAIALAPAEAVIRSDGVVVHDGRISAGMFQVIFPGQEMGIAFESRADFVHLYVGRAMFEELVDGGSAERLNLGSNAKPLHDHIVGQLGLGLVNAERSDQLAEQLFQQGICFALLARALAVLNETSKKDPAGSGGLVWWRLKRVFAFVEANLETPLSLHALAQAAGLSRMHFARQFRRATGLQPHAYVARRRVERAQDMLRDTTTPLAAIALSVGFQTQAHFTTVFGQLSGQTPAKWREQRMPISV